MYQRAKADPVNFTDNSGFWIISLGFNAQATASYFGSDGYGGYLETGYAWNTNGPNLGQYRTDATLNDSFGGLGISFAFRLTVSCVADPDNFFGPGPEFSVEPPELPFGGNLQLDNDQYGNLIGFAFGPSVGFGGGAFLYDTDTVPIASAP